jgi:hypothetical protein
MTKQTYPFVFSGGIFCRVKLCSLTNLVKLGENPMTEKFDAETKAELLKTADQLIATAELLRKKATSDTPQHQEIGLTVIPKSGVFHDADDDFCFDD